MAGRKERRPDAGTTRSPADKDIFGDEGPRVPAKDRVEPGKERPGETSEAGGVD